MNVRTLVPLLAAVTLVSVACDRKPDNSQHVDRIRAVTASTPSWVRSDALAKRLWRIERAFYQQRAFTPAWVDGDRTTAQWKDLVQQLKYSERHGLDPAKYHVAEFEQFREQSQTKTSGTRFPLDQVPELDARMTFAYLRYAADLLGWDENPKAIYEDWIVPSRKVELAGQLTDAVSKGSVRESLESLAPTHQQYKGLQAALAFERQHPSGHADQIRMNMERWRWAPHDLGDRYVLVNVPAYQMQVMEGDKPVLAMRVVVGDPKHETPLFSDEMTTVVFSPNWNVPESIIRNEMLPKLVDDPGYLQRQDIQVVGTSGQVLDAEAVDWFDESALARLHFRQAPGPKNALGLVKFQFPNAFDIYMHDTPQNALFNKEHRALSHGCVRLENPVALAEYVLRDKPEWTMEKIDEAMNAGQERAVALKEHLPVHIGYFTAWVNPDGSVTYTDDPYELDERQKTQHL